MSLRHKNLMFLDLFFKKAKCQRISVLDKIKGKLIQAYNNTFKSSLHLI